MSPLSAICRSLHPLNDSELRAVSTGRLYINDPKNKSARKKMAQYPAFDSKSGANVYFRKQDVLGGAYDSTLVFDIPPFKLDSLNGLSKSAAIELGRFAIRVNTINPSMGGPEMFAPFSPRLDWERYQRTAPGVFGTAARLRQQAASLAYGGPR